MASAPDWLTTEAGEDVVWTGGPRLRRLLSTVAGALFWGVAAVGGLVVATTVLSIDLPFLPLVGVVLLVVAYQWAYVAWQYLVTTNVEYVMTTANVYRRDGVLSESVTRVGLDKIQNVELSKDFFGTRFDYGTIGISTAGSEGWEMELEDLDDAAELRSDLRRRSSRASDRSRSRERSGPSPGPDAETLDAMVEEARGMRRSAERIRRQFS